MSLCWFHLRISACLRRLSVFFCFYTQCNVARLSYRHVCQSSCSLFPLSEYLLEIQAAGEEYHVFLCLHTGANQQRRRHSVGMLTHV